MSQGIIYFDTISNKFKTYNFLFLVEGKAVNVNETVSGELANATISKMIAKKFDPELFIESVVGKEALTKQAKMKKQKIARIFLAVHFGIEKFCEWFGIPVNDLKNAFKNDISSENSDARFDFENLTCAECAKYFTQVNKPKTFSEIAASTPIAPVLKKQGATTAHVLKKDTPVEVPLSDYDISCKFADNIYYTIIEEVGCGEKTNAEAERFEKENPRNKGYKPLEAMGPEGRFGSTQVYHAILNAASDLVNDGRVTVPQATLIIEQVLRKIMNSNIWIAPKLYKKVAEYWHQEEWFGIMDKIIAKKN
ncbi:MAG TPA: hypothetical protein VHA52_06405 [Candidatus Babeliaceae bacterium]|nr:hypothetical protein [Candidatus Babeliaceae bacterium]